MGRGPRGMGKGGRTRLTPPIVRAVVLHDRAGRSVKDIVELTSVSINVVYSILNLTVSQLKYKYGEEAWP